MKATRDGSSSDSEVFHETRTKRDKPPVSRDLRTRNEMTPEVSDEDITISRADRDRDVRSFISYAVGCMFGRYSLDVDALIYAGEFDWSKYDIHPGSDNVSLSG